MSERPGNDRRGTSGQDIEAMGGEFVERVMDLIRDGNQRWLTVKSRDDKILLGTTLTIAVIASAVILLWEFWLVVLAVVIAAVARVKVEVSSGEEGIAHRLEYEAVVEPKIKTLREFDEEAEDSGETDNINLQ